MKCRYCGEQLEKGIDVCKACGRINKSIFGSGKFNKKVIIAAAAAVVAVIVALGSVLAITGLDDIDVRLIDEKTGEYLLVNVSKNYTFDIEIDGDAADDDFTVYDIYGNKVATKNRISDTKAVIKAPEGGYKEGNVYTLDLNGQGSFIGEELENAKKITFVIKSKQKDEIVYQENVVELKDNVAELDEDTIKVDGKYGNGDIIVTDTDDDKIDEVYKLTNVEYKSGKTIAEYTEPGTDEVFKKLDVFYYNEVNFKEAEIDEEAFVGMLEEMGILEAFIDVAYADSDSEIKIEVINAKWKSVKASYLFECTLKDPKNEDRQLKVSFSVSDKLMVKADDGIAMANNSLKITSGLDFKVEGEDKASVEKSISKAIEDYQNDFADKTDKEDYDVPLVPVKVPIAGPVYASVEIGLTAEVEFSTEFNAGAEASVEFTQGIVYDYHRFKVVKKYADITGDIEAYMMVKGRLDAFAGAYVDLGVGIPGLDMGIGAKGGPYLEGEGCFTIEGIPKDIESKGYYFIEIGVMIAAEAKIDVIGFDEKTIELANKKKQLFKISEYLKLQETNLKDTYYITDDRINIGDLEATYYNVIEEENIIEPIEKYTFYIDNKEVNVKDGFVDRKISEGEHEFKLKWKYDGDKFEEVKTVELTEFDPWGYFQDISFLNESYSHIMDEYGPCIDTSTGEGAFLYKMSQHNIWAIYSTNDMSETGNLEDFYNIVKPSGKCIGMAGEAKDMLGITEGMSISELGEALRTDYRFKYTGIIEMYDAGYWYSDKTINGISYTIAIIMDDDYVNPDDYVEITLGGIVL